MSRSFVSLLLLFCLFGSGCSSKETRFTEPEGYIETYQLQHAVHILDYYELVCNRILKTLRVKRLLMVKAANGIYNTSDRSLFYNEWQSLVKETGELQVKSRLPAGGPFLFGEDRSLSIQGLRVYNPILSDFQFFPLHQKKLTADLKNKYYNYRPQDFATTQSLRGDVANQLIGETDTEIDAWISFRHQVIAIRNQMKRMPST